MNQTRKELEICVCSTNTVLRPEVSEMSLITLLRNCHPSFAGYFAAKLFEEGELTDRRAGEFPYQQAVLPAPKFNYLVYQPNKRKK